MEPVDICAGEPVNISAALATFEEFWSPRTVATVNDYDVRLVRASGEFSRHAHPETDEFFLVVAGSLTIRMDGRSVTLGAGELYVVPRGVAHQPVAAPGTSLLLFEPRGTVNTGDRPGALTAGRRVLGPVLPDRAAEDSDRAWGDTAEDRDAWLRSQRPPHHDG